MKLSHIYRSGELKRMAKKVKNAMINQPLHGTILGDLGGVEVIVDTDDYPDFPMSANSLNKTITVYLNQMFSETEVDEIEHMLAHELSHILDSENLHGDDVGAIADAIKSYPSETWVRIIEFKTADGPRQLFYRTIDSRKQSISYSYADAEDKKSGAWRNYLQDESAVEIVVPSEISLRNLKEALKEVFIKVREATDNEMHHKVELFAWAGTMSLDAQKLGLENELLNWARSEDGYEELRNIFPKKYKRFDAPLSHIHPNKDVLLRLFKQYIIKHIV